MISIWRSNSFSPKKKFHSFTIDRLLFLETDWYSLRKQHCCNQNHSRCNLSYLFIYCFSIKSLFLFWFLLCFLFMCSMSRILFLHQNKRNFSSFMMLLHIYSFFPQFYQYMVSSDPLGAITLPLLLLPKIF